MPTGGGTTEEATANDKQVGKDCAYKPVLMEDINDNEMPKQKPSLWRRFLARELEDINSFHFIRGGMMEFFGVLWLCMFVFGFGIQKPGGDAHSKEFTILAIICVVTIVVSTLYNVSGSNINPAVSMMMFATGRMTLSRCLLYMTSQTMGAATGIILLKQLAPPEFLPNLGVIKPADGVTTAQAFGIEILITGYIGFAVLSLFDPGHKLPYGDLPLTFGLCIAANYCFAVEISGACMNPAFSGGPALALGDYEYQWIYFFGPIIGCVVGGWLYDFVFSDAMLEKIDARFYDKSRACLKILEGENDNEKDTTLSKYRVIRKQDSRVELVDSHRM